MKEITLPSGRRALKDGDTLYQEESLERAPLQATLSSARWYQDLGETESGDPPAPNPVKLVEARKAMFFEPKGDKRLLVEKGDWLSVDLNGTLSVVPGERVRAFSALHVGDNPTPEHIQKVAQDVVDRIARAREAAREQGSPLSTREDDTGRGLIVSTLPDGRETTWKTFASLADADRHLEDPKRRKSLEEAHSKSARSVKSMSGMAESFRRDRNAPERD